MVEPNRASFRGQSSFYSPSGGAGGGSFNSGDQIVYNLGNQYLDSAKIFEESKEVEQAYKFYREAANKFLYLIKNNVQRSPEEEKELKILTSRAIDKGMEMKTIIDFEMNSLKAQGKQKSTFQQPLGL